MQETGAELNPDDDDVPTTVEGSSNPHTASLTEFDALRQEIMQRIGAQDRLVQLNLTALATIAGLLIAQKANTALLLVVPFLSAALGFAWLQHVRQLALIGRYIRKELWPFITHGEHAKVPSWEEFYVTPKPGFVVGVTGLVQPVVVFVGPPLLALVFSWTSAISPGLRTMWFVDFALFVCMNLLALRYEVKYVLK